MAGMRRIVQFLCSALLVAPVVLTAQVVSVPGQTSQVAPAPGLSFTILSDTKGVEFNSYLRTLAPELQQSFLSNLSAADVKLSAHQQVDLLLTIDSQGSLSALRLASGTQDSPVARAAWAAAKNVRYASPPNSLGVLDLQLRVRFLAA